MSSLNRDLVKWNALYDLLKLISSYYSGLLFCASMASSELNKKLSELHVTADPKSNRKSNLLESQAVDDVQITWFTENLHDTVVYFQIIRLAKQVTNFFWSFATLTVLLIASFISFILWVSSPVVNPSVRLCKRLVYDILFNFVMRLSCILGFVHDSVMF